VCVICYVYSHIYIYIYIYIYVKGSYHILTLLFCVVDVVMHIVCHCDLYCVALFGVVDVIIVIAVIDVCVVYVGVG